MAAFRLGPPSCYVQVNRGWKAPEPPITATPRDRPRRGSAAPPVVHRETPTLAASPLGRESEACVGRRHGTEPLSAARPKVARAGSRSPGCTHSPEISASAQAESRAPGRRAVATAPSRRAQAGACDRAAPGSPICSDGPSVALAGGLRSARCHAAVDGEAGTAPPECSRPDAILSNPVRAVAVTTRPRQLRRPRRGHARQDSEPPAIGGDDSSAQSRHPIRALGGSG
jgi:hypothetical protein